MTDGEIKIKSAIAIYRGLTDAERINKLEQIRFQSGNHPTPEVRALARKLLPAIEAAENDIQRERRAIAEQARREALRSVQTRTVYIQTGYSSPDDERRTWEMRRAVLAIGGIAIGGTLVISAVVSTVEWLLAVGAVPWILGGAFAVFCLSFLRGAPGSRTDTTAKPGDTSRQVIHINITGNGGQINIEK
jgi:hypothetical protein